MLGTETEEDAMGEGVAVGNLPIDPELGGGYACTRSSSGAAEPGHTFAHALSDIVS